MKEIQSSQEQGIDILWWQPIAGTRRLPSLGEARHPGSCDARNGRAW